MIELIERLDWDSEFFGLSIGRVNPVKLTDEIVAVILEQAGKHQIQCLYFEADPDDPTTVGLAEKNGFHLVDVRIVLEHPFDNRPAPSLRFPIPEALIIDSPREHEMQRLEDISAQIGHTSRFDFDEGFGPEESERLYRLWIKNACQGFADITFVTRWRQDGEAVGLITCTCRDSVAHIQLAGVPADYRQQGIGTALVQAALDWAKTQDARRMQVVTQARNVPAQRLYQQMGFFTRKMTLFYHKWFL